MRLVSTCTLQSIASSIRSRGGCPSTARNRAVIVGIAVDHDDVAGTERRVKRKLFVRFVFGRANLDHCVRVQPVTHFPESGLFLEEPTISPDGRWLVYNKGGGGASLWMPTLGRESIQ